MMGFLDALAVVPAFVLVFGPAVALAVYGFRRGKRAFNDRLRELGSPLQARWKSISISMKSAIVPAFAMLFGGIRTRAMKGTETDAETAWQVVGAIGLMTIVCVIVPFMLGIQRAYRAATTKND